MRLSLYVRSGPSCDIGWERIFELVLLLDATSRNSCINENQRSEIRQHLRTCDNCSAPVLPGEPKGTIDTSTGAYVVPPPTDPPQVSQVGRVVVLLTDAFGLPLLNWCAVSGSPISLTMSIQDIFY